MLFNVVELLIDGGVDDDNGDVNKVDDVLTDDDDSGDVELVDSPLIAL